MLGADANRTRPFRGNVGELAVFEGALDATERACTEYYLSSKHGATTEQSDPDILKGCIYRQQALPAPTTATGQASCGDGSFCVAGVGATCGIDEICPDGQSRTMAPRYDGDPPSRDVGWAESSQRVTVRSVRHQSSPSCLDGSCSRRGFAGTVATARFVLLSKGSSALRWP